MFRNKKDIIISLIAYIFLLILARCGSSDKFSREDFLKDLKSRTFNYFWENIDGHTGQFPDRYPTKTFTSIAATGFGLTSYIIGIENNYVSRTEGAERVKYTLNWLWNSKQGAEPSGTTGYKGFYYHFLKFENGQRFKKVELSTIDTGLLMAGILACQSYFTDNNSAENEIRMLADSLFLRVDWQWAMEGQETMSMGWHPENGFIPSRWEGYNEAMLIIIMGLGSPTYPIHNSAWNSWCKTYEWKNFMGWEHLNFSPLFGHQYSHMFIDFRGIYDPYMKEKGIDYFENSRRATLSNRDYCAANPGNFNSYSKHIWGLTACDGPANVKEGDNLIFRTYWARGASALEIADDGTISPTAAGGSIPFAPEQCIEALYTMKTIFGDSLYQEYGFKDSFNMSYIRPGSSKRSWFNPDYLGVDQGPILIQLENYQTELIWNIMKTNKYIIAGLMKAGFAGGWLDAQSLIN
jgi:hypothetical protein